MSNLTVKQETGLVDHRKTMATSIESSDIEIPKILLMQGLSDMVADRKAIMGDFVDSMTAEKLGDEKSPIEILPICMWKDFVITHKVGNKFEFKEVRPYNAETQHWRDFENREYVEHGVPHQRNLRMNYAVLLGRDASDLGAFPYVISFQRSALKCGKSIANFFLKAGARGQKPWFFTLGIGCRMEKNDQGSYFVPVISSVKETQDFSSVNESCSNWESIMLAGAAKIDNSDLETTATSNGGGEVPF
jgi:hypothetical protein